MMNCQSIRTKRSELHECVEYTKPDAIIGCESWLSKEHKNAEIFPDGTIKMSSEKTETKMEEAYLSHYMTNSLLQQYKTVKMIVNFNGQRSKLKTNP